MNKTFSGFAALLIALGVATGGAMAAGPDGKTGPMDRGFDCMRGDVDRTEWLKERLAITKDQENAWSTYVKALETNRPVPMHELMSREEFHKMPLAERQAFMAKRMEEGEAHFAAVKQAAEALLPSLSDYQKGKASEILPGLAEPGPGFGPGPRHGGPGSGPRHGGWGPGRN
ncbi:MAG: Spy/CpxP family protein refolding chaperone [Rhodospirillaceae bacterium]|nr:Spy/CpxP family protein refolding chaperone [Rhodospirillaceae bacterium]